MKLYKGYHPVIGLEIHVELSTKSKLFCACKTEFHLPPNSACCPVCTGMPGALPTLNKHALDLAIKAGLAANCEIASRLQFDRKHYFYPDLPKAYQITQYDNPLCKKGKLTFETENEEKTVCITRIHMEEDAGKLIHSNSDVTMLDFNK